MMLHASVRSTLARLAGALSLAAAPALAAPPEKPPVAPPAATKKTEAKVDKKAEEVARQHRLGTFLLLSEKDGKGAIAAFEKALRVDPKYVPAILGIAQAKLLLKDTKGQEKVLTAASKKLPDSEAVWVALGEFYRVGAPDKALAAYDKAIERNKFNALALDAALRIVEAKYRAAPSEALKQRLLGMARSRLGMFGVVGTPQGTWLKRMLTELQDGQWAVDLFDARDLYERAFTSYSMMGQLLAQAYDKLDKVLKVKANLPEALFYQGRIHESVKSKAHYDLEKAVAKYKAAGKFAPALTQLGRLHRTRDELTEARANLEGATTADARFAGGWYQLGLLEKLQGNREAGAKAFAKAYDLDPASPVAAKAVVELTLVAPEDFRIRQHTQSQGGFKGDVFLSEKFQAGIKDLESRLGGIDDQAPERAWLDAMLRKLLSATDVQTNQVFTLKVAKTKMVNAFATPNGNVYFTQGFLDMVKKEFSDQPYDVNNNAIASVMGHEITHVLKEHVMRNFVFRDAINAGRFTSQSLVAVTRTHEIEADREGMKMMFLAGYDPRYAVKMFQIYGRVLGEVPPGLDHPTFDERIQYVEEFWSNEMAFAYASFNQGVQKVKSAAAKEATDLTAAAKLYQGAIADLRRYLQAFVRSKEALNNLGLAYGKLGMFEMVQTDKESPIAKWHTEFSVEPNLALKFVALKETKVSRGPGAAGGAAPSPHLVQAKAFLDEAVKKDAAYLRARLNLGVVAIAMKNLDLANEQFAHVLGKCESANACDDLGDSARTLLGVVKAEQGKHSDAVAAFEKAVQSAPADRKATRVFNLARALENQGSKDQAIAKYKDFLALVGDAAQSSWAVHARTAVARLGAK